MPKGIFDRTKSKPRIVIEPRIRFIKKIEITDSCWNWKGPIASTGYGVFSIKKKLTGAHRFSYELFVKPIEKGLVIDHLCRNRKCVNPDHLRVVTVRENNLCGLSPFAKNAAKTHCSKGHAFIGSNIYLRPDGNGRGCNQCRSDLNKMWRRWYKKTSDL